MQYPSISAAVALTAALVLIGCDDDSQGPPPPPEHLPAPSGAALWEYLQDEDYTSWSLWPGKGELYTGSEPHGMLLTTYVNPIALEALEDDATTLPEGAIVVKENYMPDSTFVAITTMYKVRGFDPDHSDWFWLKNDPAGVVEVEGSVNDCTSCHDGAADFDYLWTLHQQASEATQARLAR